MKFDDPPWASRRKKGQNLISPAQSAQIRSNTQKVDAAGPLTTHNDVNIYDPRTGDMLMWDGSNWENVSISGGLTSPEIIAIQNSNAMLTASGPVSSHEDVQVNAPSLGDILTWDGIKWTNSSPETGLSPQQISDITANAAKVTAAGPLTTHSDVDYVETPVGSLLGWNGSYWTNI